MGENNNHDNEVKVGIFTIVGFALIFAMAVFIGKIDLGGVRGDAFSIFFTSADGIAVGNQVRYAGIRAGRVESLELLPSGIQVVVRLEPGVKVPEGSVVLLGTEGIMGARYVGIQPPANPNGKFLKPGTLINGYAPPNIDDMMASLTGLLGQVEDVVKNVNAIAGAPETQESLKLAIVNLGLMSENLRLASENLNHLSQASGGDIQAIVRNMRIASDEMRLIMTNISEDGKAGEDVRQILKDMQSIVGRMDRITESVEGLATDPQTIHDLKTTLHNASQASERVNRILGGGSGTRSTSEQPGERKSSGGKRKFFQGGVDFTYSPDESDWRGDANVTIGGHKFVRIGAQDIGEDNHVEFQAGVWRGPVAFRAGVFESKLGAGIDWQPHKRVKFSADAYDPNDFKYRLRSEFGLTKDNSTALIAQLYGAEGKGTSTYLGIRQNF